MKAVRFLLTFVAMVSMRPGSAGQEVSEASILQVLARMDTIRSLGPSGKLQLLYEWKRKSEASKLPEDSVYARLLHKIGVYEFYTSKRYNTALLLTLEAMRINTSGKPGSSPVAASIDLYNIAFYYDQLALLTKALVYYDSAILYARRTLDIDNVLEDSWLKKAYIYFRMGDYEKATDESDKARTYALQHDDSLKYLSALNQRAQALFFQGNLFAAQEDTKAAIVLSRILREDFELAGALKSQALILSFQGDYSGAESSYIECIAARVRSKQFWQVAGDYNDLGVFYGDTLKAFRKAETCYMKAIQYARKEGDSARIARACVNLGKNFYNQHEYGKAISCYSQSMDYLRIGRVENFMPDPSARELDAIGNKELVQELFMFKTELLLSMFQRNGDARWLNSCLHTALLNDSLIRDMRHEELGEHSKLYWRNKTRDFFSDALEACYLAHDDRLAFYFMEESRSVMLQDKLNELGARAYLPPLEAQKGERLQIHIVELQQQLNSLPDSSGQGRALLVELLAAKESLENYIRSLESNYPVYYQYKYADDVQPLPSLQQFLLKNRQRFVEFFMQDTLCFALCVQPTSTRFVRIVNKEPGIESRVNQFVRFCSDEVALSKDFSGFLDSANGLYRLLLEPFGLGGGRVIVCQDNVLIPFEALSTDPKEANFLVKSYSFSYVYSARYLLTRQEQLTGRGDFLGLAPVSFAAYKGLADLRLSEDALRSCSAPFTRRKLLVYTEANRRNFMRQVCDYTTTTILTHARFDSIDGEPVLFMNDSVIRLSDLQMLSKPASRLIVLSACQTNAGRNRYGEGIFSLARGFSAAGIPAVAATQWMADESAIYSILQKFNEYIFRGMNKDEALQKAKLFYMYQDKKGSLLPCYWADMVLIGNSEPVRFSKDLAMWWILPVVVLIVLIGAVSIWVGRRKWAAASFADRIRHLSISRWSMR
jgi:tetratricopeptide (TPR) repeat protein